MNIEYGYDEGIERGMGFKTKKYGFEFVITQIDVEQDEIIYQSIDGVSAYRNSLEEFINAIAEGSVYLTGEVEIYDIELHPDKERIK